MESSIAYLTELQISNFFAANGRPSQQQCNETAERITGVSPKPTLVQGTCSYTVIAEDHAVQFRAGDAAHAALDLELISHVQKAYAGFVPWITDSGKLGELYIYKMEKVGGVSLYLARDSLYRNDCHLLRQTLIDFARFFASAWHNTPEALTLPDRPSLYSKYSSQLSQLSAGLPSRFRPVLNRLIGRLPNLLARDWPLVPNHTDLLENNIHADPDTGNLMGICDWAGAEISPFGMSLGAVENMLGIPTVVDKSGRTDHIYHANHRELRGLFYDELYDAMGGITDKDKSRIEDAALIGLFLTFGWRLDEAKNYVPAGEEEHGLHHLDAVLRATYDGYVGSPPDGLTA